MKKLFVLFVLLGAGVAAVGFQRGWFQLASDRDGSKTNFTLTVDKDKIHEDEAKAMDKVQHVKEKTADKVEQHAKK